MKEQYKLSKECGISINESDLLPDFERCVYINYLLEDKRKEYEQMNT